MRSDAEVAMNKRIVFYGGLGFLVCFSLGYVYWSAPFTLNYYRIAVGMHEDEVTVILGGPNPGPDWRQGILPDTGWREGWNQGTGTIVLTYDEKCRLVSKDYVRNPPQRGLLDDLFGVEKIRE